MESCLFLHSDLFWDVLKNNEFIFKKNNNNEILAFVTLGITFEKYY